MYLKINEHIEIFFCLSIVAVPPALIRIPSQGHLPRVSLESRLSDDKDDHDVKPAEENLR